MATEPDRLVGEIRRRRARLAAGFSPLAAARSGFRRRGAWLALGVVVVAGFAVAHFLGPRLATVGKKSARGWVRKRLGQQVAAGVLSLVMHGLSTRGSAPAGGAEVAAGSAAGKTGRRRTSKPRAPKAPPGPAPEA